MDVKEANQLTKLKVDKINKKKFKQLTREFNYGIRKKVKEGKFTYIGHWSYELSYEVKQMVADYYKNKGYEVDVSSYSSIVISWHIN